MPGPKPKPPMERFIIKVNRCGPMIIKTRCHQWTAGVDKDGYPMFGPGDGRTVARGHRWLWEQVIGRIPDGKVLRHRCDNPSCVNLKHMKIGTPRNNNEDRNKRGRTSRHAQHYAAKLTLEQVTEMRQRKLDGESIYSFFAEYGITYDTAKKVVAGRRWADGTQVDRD